MTVARSTNEAGATVNARPVLIEPEESTSVMADIRAAALLLFSEQGFHGTTIRQIGKGAGVSVALMYHYFGSKHDILVALVNDACDDLINSIAEANATTNLDPVERLRSLVRAHVTHEATHRRISFVANTEVRSLNEDAKAAFIIKRDFVQHQYEEIIMTGIDEGRFAVAHSHETAIALATMCTAVNTWYNSEGPMTPIEIAHCYCDIAIRIVGYSPKDTKSRT